MKKILTALILSSLFGVSMNAYAHSEKIEIKTPPKGDVNIITEPKQPLFVSPHGSATTFPAVATMPVMATIPSVSVPVVKQMIYYR